MLRIFKFVFVDEVNRNMFKIHFILNFYRVVPPGGLEPPRPKASDFESDVSTDFTTAA